MKSIVQRFLAVKEALDISKADFCRGAEISTTSLDNYINGKGAPKALFLANICNKFGVDGTWILTGDGEMFRKDEVGDPVVLRMREAERLIKEHGEVGLEIVRLTLGTSDETSKSDPGVCDEKIASGY
ncbi:helix-turn-helix domain-containing protein [Maridesulfovibrio frigidus]|uniref:helix-turn-helix domain-containing protein n=1 Tax=Maridesulfovibrio frigidus TaxID=340956 RepID=UPI0004E1D0E1|nr:helix-turn-helix transcriptional regulator [Maridesulfovibrio frigidus]